jgi:hypothetical protein
MLGCAQDRAHAAIGHHFTGVQDHDPIAHPGDSAQIVADIDHGGAGLGIDFAQQLQNVRLRGDIQTGRRFIEQQGCRFTGQRHRNRHSLLLPTREFVRIAGQ